ncbi:hypothetical protein H1230_21315 [Paenibacillus sp. 19GGS1-52]|uniref:hypothetical protein n=1 Tax=Paenibacillus sp. 19GGS1-52 TaxID=2758563 RepID=UPI001EFB07B5|nr:hypothetical protein [Paenibacillus sp. 19GGS1-52]ULO05600.1 hypothetical protein H1230_21315 [Paenibacillus sp. 19GGS1-52]
MAAEHIVMHIRDNSILESSKKINEGFGLKVMKTRMEERGGRLRYLIPEPEVIIKVLLADDQKMIRQGLGYVIGLQKEIPAVSLYGP